MKGRGKAGEKVEGRREREEEIRAKENGWEPATQQAGWLAGWEGIPRLDWRLGTSLRTEGKGRGNRVVPTDAELGWK